MAMMHNVAETLMLKLLGCFGSVTGSISCMSCTVLFLAETKGLTCTLKPKVYHCLCAIKAREKATLGKLSLPNDAYQGMLWKSSTGHQSYRCPGPRCFSLTNTSVNSAVHQSAHVFYAVLPVIALAIYRLPTQVESDKLYRPP